MGKRGPIAAILDAAGSSIEKIASATVILADEDDFPDKTKSLTPDLCGLSLKAYGFSSAQPTRRPLLRVADD